MASSELTDDEKISLQTVLKRNTDSNQSVSPTRAARDFLREEGGRNIPSYMVREYYNILVNNGLVEMDSDIPERPKYRWMYKNN